MCPGRRPRQPIGRQGRTRPRQCQGQGAATVLAGIRAGGSSSIAFPGTLFRRAQWLVSMEAEWRLRAFVRLPLRGQRRLGVH